ncbi:hypothetical protein BSKO_10988 [Bryopsis sp. KO-2023]|nr:hypothetical protein BSKO_10988 [Bryopsis sp. KO-2023]
MDKFEKKMRDAGLSESAIKAFKGNYEQLTSGATGLFPENEIAPVESLPNLDDMKLEEGIKLDELLAQSAVLKLNGGLGTSMGLEKAKSLLPLKEGKTFLDFIANQIKHTRATYKSDVKFILMNSFSTSADTKEFLSKSHGDLLKEPYIELMQNKSPKVDAETMEPATYEPNPDAEWCPPGHGDIYISLVGSGMLDSLIKDGVKYLFVSNSDNLGATLDLKLLSFFAASDKAFLMEVCERTASDKKGGHLCVRKKDNRIMLRESAMCPDEDKPHFENIEKHKFFNTNSLWVNLPKLKATMEKEGGVLPLPMIKNKKTVDPRDSSTSKVFQLETAMGSAIECFDDAGAVVVPRSRFAPVKTCSDLFSLRSDAYTVTPEHTVVLAGEKGPLVKLDDKFYKLVDKMEALVKAPPSMRECTSLTVKGSILFAPGVLFKGDVKLENDSSQPVELAAGEYVNTDLNLTPAKVPATV